MLRIALIVVAVLTPFIFYAVYARWVKRRSDEAKAAGQMWSDAPWTALIGAALALAIAVMVAYGLATGEDPAGHYTPPRMVDGKVAPAEVK